MSTPSSIPSPLERAGSDLRVALALGLLHFAVSVAAVLRDTFLNNEGIFTYISAGMMGSDPVTTLFFLKSRPPIAALYAAPAALGFDAFAIVHALVASAAIPLTAVLSRALGQRWPNLAAALVAASAMLLAGGASGVGNADALTLGVLAAVCLFAWDRPLIAGLLCALLPLARAETTLLVIPLALHAVFRGDARVRWRFLAGLFGVGLAYAALGALYHEDAIWFLHHPPHVTHSVPFSEVMGPQMFGGDPHKVTLTLLTLTPSVGLLLFLRPRSLSHPEQAIGLFLVLFLGILEVLPSVSPLNFGDMPRYVLPAVPFLALFASRAIESLAEGTGRAAYFIGVAGLLGLLVVAHYQDAEHQAPALLWAVAGWSSILLLASTRYRRAVPLLVLALSFAATPFLIDATRLTQRRDTLVLGRYLLEHASADTVVLTNVGEVPLWLERNGGEHIEAHHLLAADQRYELDSLASDAVGQREAVHALMRRHWYGPIVFPEEIEARLRPGTWLALRGDARTGHILDESLLVGRSETVDLGGGVRLIKVTGP